MAGVTDTTIDNLLDQVFARPEMGELFARGFSPCWNKLKNAAPKNINNKGGFYLVRTAIPNSLMSGDFAASAGGEFPNASESEYLMMKVLAITDRATVEFNGNTEAQNRAELKQAPAKTFNHIVEEIGGENISYGKAKSRQLWQNRSNEIGRVTAVNTGTSTITCAVSSGNLFGVQHIDPKSPIEFRDSSGVLRNTGSALVIVNTTNRAATTFTYTGTLPTGVVAGDRIYPYKSYNAGWAGVPYLTNNSGAYQGIADRTGYPQMSGTQIPAGGQTLNLALLRKLQSSQYLRRSGEEATGEFYGSAQYDAYEATGFALQMYGQSGETMKQGFRNLYFDGTPFNRDFWIPRDELHKVNWTAIDKFELLRFGPVNDNGQYGHRVPTANGTFTDKKQLLMQGFGNLGAENPSAVGGAITGLNTAGLALGNE